MLQKDAQHISLYGSDFAEAFSKLLDTSGVTRYKIKCYTGLDEAYLSRLRSGEQSNPSMETIIRIGLALAYYSKKIDLYDIERLFQSVGRTFLHDKGGSIISHG